METPDLSSLDIDVWAEFIRTTDHVKRGYEHYYDTYDRTVTTYGEDLAAFKLGVAVQDPRALEYLAQFVLWRMNNNQGESP